MAVAAGGAISGLFVYSAKIGAFIVRLLKALILIYHANYYLVSSLLVALRTFLIFTWSLVVAAYDLLYEISIAFANAASISTNLVYSAYLTLTNVHNHLADLSIVCAHSTLSFASYVSMQLGDAFYLVAGLLPFALGFIFKGVLLVYEGLYLAVTIGLKFLISQFSTLMGWSHKSFIQSFDLFLFSFRCIIENATFMTKLVFYFVCWLLTSSLLIIGRVIGIFTKIPIEIHLSIILTILLVVLVRLLIIWLDSNGLSFPWGGGRHRVLVDLINAGEDAAAAIGPGAGGDPAVDGPADGWSDSETEEQQLSVDLLTSSATEAAGPSLEPETVFKSAEEAEQVGARAIQKQLEKERDQRRCVICQDRQKNVLVMPCRHLCLCNYCANEIATANYIRNRTCPLCRKQIETVMSVYA